jgi:hypothetical protein
MDQKSKWVESHLPAVLPTHQAASFLNRAPQTLRKWACLDCATRGIRPICINGRLAWKVSDLQMLLEVGVK